jgi:hypothetical protein
LAQQQRQLAVDWGLIKAAVKAAVKSLGGPGAGAKAPAARGGAPAAGVGRALACCCLAGQLLAVPAGGACWRCLLAAA